MGPGVSKGRVRSSRVHFGNLSVGFEGVWWRAHRFLHAYAPSENRGSHMLPWARPIQTVAAAQLHGPVARHAPLASITCFSKFRSPRARNSRRGPFLPHPDTLWPLSSELDFFQSSILLCLLTDSGTPFWVDGFRFLYFGVFWIRRRAQILGRVCVLERLQLFMNLFKRG